MKLQFHRRAWISACKYFVNSGINAAPKVPQLITIDNMSHRLFGRCPISNALTANVTIIETIDVIQTEMLADVQNRFHLCVNKAFEK